MHIGLITTSFPRWPGDPAGGFVAEHASWLASAGHRVDVVAAAPGQRRAVGCDVIRVGGGGELFYRGGAPEALAGGWRWHLAAGFGVAQSAAVIRRIARWDAVIAHWLVPSGAVAVAAAVIGRRDLPILAIAHSGDVHLLGRSRWKLPVARLLARATTVFVTAELRDRFTAGLPARLAARFAAAPICSMGVDVGRFRRAAAAAPSPRRPATVLFLGRLVPVKGIEVAIAAAARWRSDARLVIAGAGPGAADLRRRAAALPAGRVKLVGEVYGEQRDRLLASADLLVLPSVRVEAGRTEGLPVTALEAMATRVPLVASRVGGLAELPEGVARLVAPGQPTALAEAIDELLARPELASRQVEVAQKLVVERDWSVVGPRLLAYMSAKIRNC